MAHLIGKVSLPKSAYSMYDIAKFESINEKKISQLMRTTLKRTKEVSNEKSISGITTWFNEIGAEDTFINAFLTHWSLQPFAKAIKLSIERIVSVKGNTTVDSHYAMFYVPKVVYEDWKRKGIEYKKLETEVQAFSAKDRAKKLRFEIPTTTAIEHFKKVVKANDRSLAEIATLAIEYFMENHKSFFGEYTKEVDESMVQENSMSLIHAYIDKNIVNKLWKTLQRYNQINTPAIKLSDFVESAIAEKLERTPIKYTNPKLYEEVQIAVRENKQLEQEFHESER